MTGSGQLAELAALRCRARSQPLGPGPSAAELVRRAAGAVRGLVCLDGAWAGGGALLAFEPLVVLSGDADPIESLGVLPRLVDEDRNAPAGTAGHVADVVGGGWFGWLAYDGASRLAFYDHLLRRDAHGDWHFETLWSPERDAVFQARREQCAGLLAATGALPRWKVGAFGGADVAGHLAAVERAIELIRAGEIYQVNVCTRLSAPFAGSPAALFAHAVAELRPAYGGFVEAPDRAIASLSPELFLRRRGRHVTTAPIKGTWPETDPTGAAALRASAKDAAENVMIVDLMRNDLGRVCTTGSVRATSLLTVERHPGVWHLVSTVAGRLRPDVDDAALLRATFPPGSVTGAPKLRAISVAASLEAGPRGAYTGAFGFVSPVWGAEFAVAIRTFEIGSRRVELGVGGGVTADSVPMLEWRECLHKAAPLLGALGAAHVDRPSRPAGSCDPPGPTAAQRAGGLLETIACLDGRPLRMAEHLARLERSSRELYRRGLPAGLAEEVSAAARAADSGRGVVRVRLGADGSAAVTGAALIGAPPAESHLRVVTDRTGLWRHKWADRDYLDALEAAGPPLFVAADGTVLETGRGNVFLLQPSGTLVTPPLRDDLLPGTTRRAVLDLARDTGRRTELRGFPIASLVASAAFWTSSLSLAVPIASVDGITLPRRDDEIAELAAGLSSGWSAGRGARLSGSRVGPSPVSAVSGMARTGLVR